MSGAPDAVPSWETVRSRLQAVEPEFYELEPGGSLALGLDEEEGWILEVTPDGRVICQIGMDMDDIKTLMSDGTCEDLGSDEVAKQAKFYLQPAVTKKRKALLGAGFEETTEMNDQYVATLFQRAVDFRNTEDVAGSVRWCREQFRRRPVGRG
ncbi:MAG: hypothetical protein HZB35_12280 [Nitrospirae bacterium]|nr:hypothetical protein [Nitrospirota bacterium]